MLGRRLLAPTRDRSIDGKPASDRQCGLPVTLRSPRAVASRGDNLPRITHDTCTKPRKVGASLVQKKESNSHVEEKIKLKKTTKMKKQNTRTSFFLRVGLGWVGLGWVCVGGRGGRGRREEGRGRRGMGDGGWWWWWWFRQDVNDGSLAMPHHGPAPDSGRPCSCGHDPLAVCLCTRSMVVVVVRMIKDTRVSVHARTYVQ